MKQFVNFLFILFFLSSCIRSVEDSDNKVEEPMCRLDLSIGQIISQIPMGEKGELSTRSSFSLAEYAKELSLFVVDKGGSVKAEVTQSSSEDGYGMISMSLPHGSYTLVAIAHNGSRSSYASGIISFADNKVTDSFIGSKEVTLSSTTSAETATITLYRRVAKLSVNMKDALPDGIKEAKVTMSGYSSRFDTSTGFGTQSEPLTRTFDLTGRDGQTDITISVFTFVPYLSHTTSLTYTVTDVDGRVLFDRTFPSLSLVDCTQTLVYGNFFSSQNIWTIEMSGDWKDSIEHNINE